VFGICRVRGRLVLLVIQFTIIAMSLVERQILLSDTLVKSSDVVSVTISWLVYIIEMDMDVWEIQIVPIRIQISLFVFDFNVDIKWVYLNLISDRYLKNMEYSILSISTRKLISMSNGVMVIK
jgi:hypothetical protein